MYPPSVAVNNAGCSAKEWFNRASSIVSPIPSWFLGGSKSYLTIKCHVSAKYLHQKNCLEHQLMGGIPLLGNAIQVQVHRSSRFIPEHLQKGSKLPFWADAHVGVRMHTNTFICLRENTSTGRSDAGGAARLRLSESASLLVFMGSYLCPLSPHTHSHTHLKPALTFH